MCEGLRARSGALYNRGMKSPRLGRNSVWLAAMLGMGAIYTGLLYAQGTLAGSVRWDGAIGVLLGLYMASHPAGNGLDMLLFMRSEVREHILTTASGRLWLALNLVVLLAAWFVIFVGVLRFVRKTA